MTAIKLPTISVERPWGVETLPPPFQGTGGKRIGEIWFDPPADCAILVKYLFTSAPLSIQVHPDDRQAQARGLEAGKEECWFILEAEPGATLGIGTRKSLSQAELRRAAETGEIEALMEWHPVEAGMFFHIPPGTVHAIGAGISLVEIQQNSDVTYRLYDYGRPRELHLADGGAVAKCAPMAPQRRRIVDLDRSERLLESTHFGLAHIAGEDMSPLPTAMARCLVVPLRGVVEIAGLGVRSGECAWASEPAMIQGTPDSRFLTAWPGA